MLISISKDAEPTKLEKYVTKKYDALGSAINSGSSKIASKFQFVNDYLDRHLALKNYLAVTVRYFPTNALTLSSAFFDPGNISEGISAGATFQYQMLFAVFISNVFAMVLQALCVKLGLVTQMDLAECCKKYIKNKYVVWFLFFCGEVSIVFTDIGEIIGASVSWNILFGIPYIWGCLLTVGDCFLVLIMYNSEGNNSKSLRIVNIIVGLFSSITMCLCIVELARIPISTARHVFDGFLPYLNRLKDHSYCFQFVSIFGAVIMPHLSYISTSSYAITAKEITKKNNQGDKTRVISKRFVKREVLKMVISLFFMATFVNAAMVIIGASIYGTPQADGASLFTFSAIMKRYVNQQAVTIFAITLLLTGLSSTFLVTMASEIITCGFVNWNIKPYLLRFSTRVVACIPCVIIASFLKEQGLAGSINLSQVMLGILIIPTSAPLIYFTCNKEIMTVKEYPEPEEMIVVAGNSSMSDYEKTGNQKIEIITDSRDTTNYTEDCFDRKQNVEIIADSRDATNFTEDGFNDKPKMEVITEVREDTNGSEDTTCDEISSTKLECQSFIETNYQNGMVMKVVSITIWAFLCGLNMYTVIKSMNKESLGF